MITLARLTTAARTPAPEQTHTQSRYSSERAAPHWPDRAPAHHITAGPGAPQPLAAPPDRPPATTAHSAAVHPAHQQPRRAAAGRTYKTERADERGRVPDTPAGLARTRIGPALKATNGERQGRPNETCVRNSESIHETDNIGSRNDSAIHHQLYR